MTRGVSEDEIDYFILRKCIDQYEKAKTDENLKNDKCAREIDLLKALAEIIGESGAILEHRTDIVLIRLAPEERPKPGPLCRCSNSNLKGNKHKYHIRAFLDSRKKAVSAWERITELKKKIAE